jgi:hypothetical protein
MATSFRMTSFAPREAMTTAAVAGAILMFSPHTLFTRLHHQHQGDGDCGIFVSFREFRGKKKRKIRVYSCSFMVENQRLGNSIT